MFLPGLTYQQVLDKEEKTKYHHFGDLFSNYSNLENFQSYVTSAGTCQGDSGGPAYLKSGNHYVVIGMKYVGIINHLLRTDFNLWFFMSSTIAWVPVSLKRVCI